MIGIGVILALGIVVLGTRLVVWVIRLLGRMLVWAFVLLFRVMPDVLRTLRWRMTIRGFGRGAWR